MMKLVSYVVLMILGLTLATVHATETVPEKVEATSKELKREAKKTVNRAEEALCTESEAECLQRKMKNRTEETWDTLKDKATDLKNKLD